MAKTMKKTKKPSKSDLRAKHLALTSEMLRLSVAAADEHFKMRGEGWPEAVLSLTDLAIDFGMEDAEELVDALGEAQAAADEASVTLNAAEIIDLTETMLDFDMDADNTAGALMIAKQILADLQPVPADYVALVGSMSQAIEDETAEDVEAFKKLLAEATDEARQVFGEHFTKAAAVIGVLDLRGGSTDEE